MLRAIDFHGLKGVEFLAFVFRSQFVHDGRHRAAGTAPFGPEVDDHRLIACDQRFEIVFVDCQCHSFEFFVDYQLKYAYAIE